MSTDEANPKALPYATFFSVMPDAAAIFDAETYEFIEVNQAALELYGYTRQEFLSLKAPDLATDLAPSETAIQEVRNGKTDHLRITCHRRKDGTVFPVRLSACRVDMDGRPVICGIARDVSDLIKAGEAARQADEEWAHTFDAAPDPTAILDDRHGIVRVNKAMADRLGLSPDECMGRPCYEIVHGMDHPPEFCPHTKTLANGQVHTIEVDEKRMDGFFSVSTSPLTDADGRVRGSVHIAHDISKRRETEIALRRERDFIAAVLGAVDALIIVLDRDGKIVSFNLACERTSGYTAEEVEGRSVWDFLLLPEERELVEEAFGQLLETGRSDRMENHWLTKTGEKRLVEWSPAVLRGPGGAVEFVIGAGLDVTEMHQTREQLRRGEKVYQLLTDNIPVVVFSAFATPDEPKLLISGRVKELTGYTAEEFARDRALYDRILHADDRGRYWAAVNEQIENRASLDIEYRIITKDGVTKWVRDRTAITPNPHGGILRVDGVLEDVTDRKAAEEMLELAQFSIDNADISVFWITPMGRFVFVNDAACKKLGYTREELIGMSVADIDPAYPHKGTAERWASFQEAGSFITESQHRTKDGRLFPVEISAHYVQFGGKEYQFAFARDITERHEAEERLRQSQKMQAVGHLASGVAHDFRNQLAIIEGYAEMLLRRSLVTEEGKPRVEEILAAAERSARTAAQLLAFSRKEALQPRTVCLRDEVAELARSLPTMLGEDIRLVIIPSSCDCVAWLDTSQFHQAIVNLALNARDAMPGGGEITIETGCLEPDSELASRHPRVRIEDHVFVAVSDRGVGMDEQTREQMFEPFFTTKDPGRGTGLGLSVVYGFVRQSDGFIDCDSQPGVGTTFRLCFPRIDAEASEPEPEPTAAPPGGAETILLVEDEQALRNALASSLDEVGYTVLDAANGNDALSKLAGFDGLVDLVITDVVLPGANGYRLAQQIHQARPTAKIMFITGYGGDRLSQEGIPKAQQEVLTKPFSHNVFLKTIRKFLDTDHT